MDFNKFNIKIPSGATGTCKTICPACTPHTRKPANRNSKDLSVNIIEGLWKCHNCGWTGTAKAKAEKVYVKPVEINLPLSGKTIEWFAGRGIKSNTLKFFGITEKMEYMPQVQKEMNCIIFPYKVNNQWVNAKYRDGKKNFKLTKDAELVLFNLDAITGKTRALITEGEIDAMSVHEVGFMEVCSVPNGASKGNQRLDYIDNCWSAFSECEKIYIATDNDEPGIALKNELVRRLGRDRCHQIEYPTGCKDLNEVLVKMGVNHVWDCINNSIPFPVEGIIRLSDFEKELDSVYEFGFTPGQTVGFIEFDEHINFSGGQVTVVTGVPNSGKSAFLDQLLIKLAEKYNSCMGVCSFENQPLTRHAANLSQCYIGKTFYGSSKMDKPNYEAAKHFLHTHFFWFKMTDEDCTIDGILERMAMLVKTHGINYGVIDPYNYVESKRGIGQTETEYISEFLSKVCNFAKYHQVHLFIVAHPTKIKKIQGSQNFEVPTLYDISGSANWFNKPDNGITVYRENTTDIVSAYIQKIRFFINGKKGRVDFDYDVYTGRYTPHNELVIKPTPEPDRPNAGIVPPVNYNRPPATFWNETDN